MIKKLPAHLKELISETIRQKKPIPEWGMGYNVYHDTDMATEKVTKWIILDNEFIIEEKETTNLLSAIALNRRKIRNPPFLNNATINNFQVNPKYGSSSNQGPLVYSYKSKVGDLFVRLSAFQNDKRIINATDILPQTYATSIADINEVPSGLAAVGRYALPAKLSACHLYILIPPPKTLIQIGSVFPGYGLAGGGVEVYFPNGYKNGTASYWRTIPVF